MWDFRWTSALLSRLNKRSGALQEVGLGGDHDDAGDQILIPRVLKPLGRTIVPQQWGIVALVGIEALTQWDTGDSYKLPPGCPLY